MPFHWLSELDTKKTSVKDQFIGTILFLGTIGLVAILFGLL